MSAELSSFTAAALKMHGPRCKKAKTLNIYVSTLSVMWQHVSAFQYAIIRPSDGQLYL
jgi:hypothetical protein